MAKKTSVPSGAKKWVATSVTSIAGIAHEMVSETNIYKVTAAAGSVVKAATDSTIEFGRNLKEQAKNKKLMVNLGKSPAVKKANSIMKAGIDDIKSGNFGYRQTGGGMFSLEDDGEFSFDMDFDDFDGDNNEEGASAATMAQANMMEASTSATIMSNTALARSMTLANLNAMDASATKITSATLGGFNMLNANMIRQTSFIENINNNVQSLLEFYNSNVSQTNQATLKFMDKAAETFELINESYKTKKGNTPKTASVWDDFFATEDESLIGSMFGKYASFDTLVSTLADKKDELVQGAKDLAATFLPFLNFDDPQAMVQSIIRSTVANGLKNLVPKDLREAMGSVDRMLPQAVGKAMLNNTDNFAVQLVTELLGIDIKSDTKLKGSMASIRNLNRGAMEFNGDTQRAITEIIPDFLSQIEFNTRTLPEYTNKSQGIMMPSASSRQYVNYKTGKIETAEEMQDRLMHDMQKMYEDAMEDARAEFGKFALENNYNEKEASDMLSMFMKLSFQASKMGLSWDNEKVLDKVLEDGQVDREDLKEFLREITDTTAQYKLDTTILDNNQFQAIKTFNKFFTEQANGSNRFLRQEDLDGLWEQFMATPMLKAYEGLDDYGGDYMRKKRERELEKAGGIAKLKGKTSGLIGSLRDKLGSLITIDPSVAKGIKQRGSQLYSAIGGGAALDKYAENLAQDLTNNTDQQIQKFVADWTPSEILGDYNLLNILNLGGFQNLYEAYIRKDMDVKDIQSRVAEIWGKEYATRDQVERYLFLYKTHANVSGFRSSVKLGTDISDIMIARQSSLYMDTFKRLQKERKKSGKSTEVIGQEAGKEAAKKAYDESIEASRDNIRKKTSEEAAKKAYDEAKAASKKEEDAKKAYQEAYDKAYEEERNKTDIEVSAEDVKKAQKAAGQAYKTAFQEAKEKADNEDRRKAAEGVARAVVAETGVEDNFIYQQNGKNGVKKGDVQAKAIDRIVDVMVSLESNEDFNWNDEEAYKTLLPSGMVTDAQDLIFKACDHYKNEYYSLRGKGPQNDGSSTPKPNNSKPTDKQVKAVGWKIYKEAFDSINKLYGKSALQYLQERFINAAREKIIAQDTKRKKNKWAPSKIEFEAFKQGNANYNKALEKQLEGPDMSYSLILSQYFKERYGLYWPDTAVTVHSMFERFFGETVEQRIAKEKNRASEAKITARNEKAAKKEAEAIQKRSAKLDERGKAYYEENKGTAANVKYDEPKSTLTPEEKFLKAHSIYLSAAKHGRVAESWKAIGLSELEFKHKAMSYGLEIIDTPEEAEAKNAAKKATPKTEADFLELNRLLNIYSIDDVAEIYGKKATTVKGWITKARKNNLWPSNTGSTDTPPPPPPAPSPDDSYADFLSDIIVSNNMDEPSTSATSGAGGGNSPKKPSNDELVAFYRQFQNDPSGRAAMADKYGYASEAAFKSAMTRAYNKSRARESSGSQGSGSGNRANALGNAQDDDEPPASDLSIDSFIDDIEREMLGGNKSSRGSHANALGDAQDGDDASLGDVINANKGLVIGLFESFLSPAYEQIFGKNGILRQIADSQFAQELKTSLIGTPDSNGIYKNGMFSDLANDLADVGDHIKYLFTGKGYTSRAGETYADDENSIGNKLKQGVAKAYDFTMQHLFGEDYKNNPTFKKTFGAISDWFTERKKKKQQYQESLTETETTREVDNGSTADSATISRSGELTPDAVRNLSNDKASGAEERAEDAARDITEGNETTTDTEAEQERAERLMNRTRDARKDLWAQAGVGLNYFGERLNTLLYGEENEEVLKSKGYGDDMIAEVQEAYKTSLKDKVVGAGAGAIIGGVAAASTGGHLGLLGSLFLPGGPIGGAIVGGALGILSRNEKFKEFLFGPKDEDGVRTGGLISKEMYVGMKKAMPHAIGGAVLGGLKGLFLPNLGLPGPLGFMAQTLLPGGPIGGAIVGMGASMLWHNEKFQRMLFGDKDEETGEYSGGAISGLANKVSGFFNKNKDNIISGTKGAILGGVAGGVIHQMGYLGAALTPGGPIGGAIAGLGIGILSHNDRFKKWLFGEKDEEGNRISDGLFQRTYNMLNATILDDMKGVVNEAAEGIAYFWKVDVALAAEKALDPLKDLADTIKDKIEDLFEKIKDGVFKLLETVFQPITTFLYTKLLKPLGGILKNVTFGAAKITGKLLTSPLKMIGLLSAPKRAMDTMKMYRSYLRGDTVIGGKKVKTDEVDENGNPIYKYEDVKADSYVDDTGEEKKVTMAQKFRNIFINDEDEAEGNFNEWLDAYMESQDKGWAFDYRNERKIKRERKQSHYARRKENAQKKVTQKWAQLLGGEGTKELTAKQLRDFKIDITKLHKKQFGKNDRHGNEKTGGLTDDQYKELMSGDHDAIMDFIYHRDEYMQGGKERVDKLLGRATGPIGKVIEGTKDAIVNGVSNVGDTLHNIENVVREGFRRAGIDVDNAGQSTPSSAGFLGGADSSTNNPDSEADVKDNSVPVGSSGSTGVGGGHSYESKVEARRIISDGIDVPNSTEKTISSGLGAGLFRDPTDFEIEGDDEDDKIWNQVFVRKFNEKRFQSIIDGLVASGISEKDADSIVRNTSRGAVYFDGKDHETLDIPQKYVEYASHISKTHKLSDIKSTVGTMANMKKTLLAGYYHVYRMGTMSLSEIAIEAGYGGEDPVASLKADFEKYGLPITDSIEADVNNLRSYIDSKIKKGDTSDSAKTQDDAKKDETSEAEIKDNEAPAETKASPSPTAANTPKPDSAFMDAYNSYIDGTKIADTCKKLGISEAEFRKKLKEYGLPNRKEAKAKKAAEEYKANHPEDDAELEAEVRQKESEFEQSQKEKKKKGDSAEVRNEPDLDALGGDASDKIDKDAKAGGLSQHESNLAELFGGTMGFAMNSALIEKEKRDRAAAEEAKLKGQRGELGHKEKISDKVVGVVEAAKEKTKSLFDTILGSLASAFLNPAFLANLLTLLGLADVLANGANSLLAKASGWILDKLKGAGSWIWDQAKKLGTKVTDAFGFTDHTGARTGLDDMPILNDNAVGDAIGAGLRIAGGGSLGGFVTERITKPILTRSLTKGLANAQRGTEFATKAFELAEKNASGKGNLITKIQEKYYKGKVASGMKAASRFSGAKLGRKGIAEATGNAIMSQGVIKNATDDVIKEFEKAGGLELITKNADDAAKKAFDKVMKETGDEVAAKAAMKAAKEESLNLGQAALRKSAMEFGQKVVSESGADLIEKGGKEALEKAVREGMSEGLVVAEASIRKAGTNAIEQGAGKITGNILEAGIKNADELGGKAMSRVVAKGAEDGTGKAMLKGLKDVATGQKSIIGAFIDLIGGIFKGVKNFIQKLFGGKVVAEFAEFDVVEKELIKAAKNNSAVAEIVEKSGAKNMKTLLKSTSAESKELVSKAAEVVAKQKGAVAEQVGKETVNQVPFLNIIFAILGCITSAADTGVVAKRFMVHKDKVNFLMRTCSGVYGLIENFPHIGMAVMIIDLVMDIIFHKSFAAMVCTTLYKAVCGILGHIEMAATVIVNTLMTAALGPVSVLVNMVSKLLSGKTLGGWITTAAGKVTNFFGFDAAEAAKKAGDKLSSDLEEGQAEFQEGYMKEKMEHNGALTLDAYNDEHNKSWFSQAWDTTKKFWGWDKKSDAEVKSGYDMMNEENAASMSTVPEDYQTSFDNASIGSININSAYIPMGGSLDSMNVGQLNTEATTFENSGITTSTFGYDFADNSVHTTPGYGKSSEYMSSVGVNVGLGPGRAVGFGDTQNDPRWANVPIGKMPDGSVSTMATGGCGPTALSNVANYLEMGKAIGRGLMEKFNPVSIAKYAGKKGYLVDGGSSADLFDKGSSELGLSASRISSNQLGSSLDKGPVIVAGKSNGSSDVYTGPGHILTAYGRSGNNALIDDGMHSGIRKVPLSSLTKGFTHGWSYGGGFEKKSVGGGPSIGFGSIIDTRTFGSYQLSTFVNQFYNKSIKRIDNEISLANKIHILLTNFIDVISRSSNNETLGHMNSTLAAFREFFDTFLSNYTSTVNQNQSALKTSYDKAADYYETEVVQNDGKNVVVKIATVPKSEVATLFSIYEKDVTNDMQKIASLVYSILHMKVLGNLCTAILSVVENTTKMGGLKLLTSYVYKKLYPTSNVLTNAQIQYELDLTRLQNGDKNSNKAGGSEKAKMDELANSGNIDNYNTKTATSKKSIWSSVVGGVKKVGSAVKSVASKVGKAVKSGLSKAWNWTKSVLGYGPGEAIVKDAFDNIGNVVDGYSEVINQTNGMTSSALGYGGVIDANKVVKWVTSDKVLNKSTFPDGSPSSNMCGRFARLAMEAGGAAPQTTGGNGNVYPRTNKIKPGANGKIDYSKIGVGVPIGIKYGTGQPGLQYGHVGIYIGNGMLVDAGGSVVKKRNIDDWYRSFVTNNANGGNGKTNEMGWSYKQPGGYEISPHTAKASVSISDDNDSKDEVSDDIAAVNGGVTSASYTNDTAFTKLADIIIKRLGLSGLVDSGADKYSVFSDSGVSTTSDATSSSSGNAANYSSKTKDGSFNGVSLQHGDMKAFSKLSEKQIKTILDEKWVKGHPNSLFTSSNTASNAKMIAKAQDETNISAIVPLMIGAWESGWGTSNIAKNKLNLWGWNATNKNPYANAKAFGSNMYEAFKGYTTDFIGLYYDKRGAKSINDVGTGNNNAHAGYAYTDSGQISTEWAPNVASVGKSQISAISSIGKGPAIAMGYGGIPIGYGTLSRQGVVTLASSIKKAAAPKKWNYSHSHRNLTIGDKTMSVRPDCSGLVSSVLMFSDNLPSGQSLNSSSIADKSNSVMKKAGFTSTSYNKSNLQAGDVVALNGHTEIYAGKVDGSDKAYNWGYDGGVQSASPTGFSNMAFTTTWKPGGTGNGKISGSSSSGGTRVVPVNITKDLLTAGEAHGRAGLKLKPTQIAVHWTGDPGASAKNIRNYFENGGGGNHTSSHYVVGLNGEIIQMVPENEQCAATNDENATAIAIETCVNDDTGKFSPTTENSLINLTANIAQRNGISVDGIIRHYDAHKNGKPRLKDCPRWWAPNGPNPNAEADWKAFKSKVKAKMDTGKVVSNGSTSDSGSSDSNSVSSLDPLTNWINSVANNLFGGFLSNNSQNQSVQTTSSSGTNSGTTKSSSSDGKATDIPSDAGNSGDYASPHTATIWNVLRKLGYSKEATSAIMGNMYQESGINPTIVNSIGATGLSQWLGGRLTNLKNYAKSKGKDWSDVTIQTEWVDQEMQGKDPTTLSLLKKKVGGYDAFKKMTDINKAVEVFETSFERAGTSEANIPRRQKAANAYFNKFSSIGSGPLQSKSIGRGAWGAPPKLDTVTKIKNIRSCLSSWYNNANVNLVGKLRTHTFRFNTINPNGPTLGSDKMPLEVGIGHAQFTLTVNNFTLTHITYEMSDVQKDIAKKEMSDLQPYSDIISYDIDLNKSDSNVKNVKYSYYKKGLFGPDLKTEKMRNINFMGQCYVYNKRQDVMNYEMERDTDKAYYYVVALIKKYYSTAFRPLAKFTYRSLKEDCIDLIKQIAKGSGKYLISNFTHIVDYSDESQYPNYVHALRETKAVNDYIIKHPEYADFIMSAHISNEQKTAAESVEMMINAGKDVANGTSTDGSDDTSANEYGVEPATFIERDEYLLKDPYTDKDSTVYIRNGAVYYAQNSDLWKDLKTAGNNTIGGSGCQYTVYDMLASSMSLSQEGEGGTVRGYDFNPKTVLENGLKDEDGSKKYFADSGIIQQAGVDKLMVDFNSKTGRSISADTSYTGDAKATLERLAKAVSSSHRFPVMITGKGAPYTSGSGTHAMLVTSINDDGSQFYVNDPGDKSKETVNIADLAKGFEKAVLFKGTKDGVEYGLGDLIEMDSDESGDISEGEETKEANWMTKLTSIIIAKLTSLLTGEDYERIYDENNNFVGKTSLGEIFGISSGDGTTDGTGDEAEILDDGTTDSGEDENGEIAGIAVSDDGESSGNSSSSTATVSTPTVTANTDDSIESGSTSALSGSRSMLLSGVRNKIINYLNADGNEQWKKQILSGGATTFYSIGTRVGNILPHVNSNTTKQDQYCEINVNNGKIHYIKSVNKKAENNCSVETIHELYHTKAKNTGIRHYTLIGKYSGRVKKDAQAGFNFSESDLVILEQKTSTSYTHSGDGIGHSRTTETTTTNYWTVSKATGYGDDLQQKEYISAKRNGEVRLPSSGDRIESIGKGPEEKPAVMQSAPIKVKPTSMKSSKATHSDIHKAIYGKPSSGLSKTAMGPGTSAVKTKNVSANDEFDELLKGLSDEERNKMQTQISRAKNILNMSNPQQAIKAFKSSDMAKAVGYGDGSELKMSKKIMSELKSSTPASSIVDFGKYSSIGHGPELNSATTNKVDVKVQTGEVETKMDTMITYLRMMANSITNGNSTINFKEVKNEINNFNGKGSKSASKSKTSSSSSTDLKKRYSSINKGSRYATT